MKVKSIKERIMQYFFLNPTERLRVRQIERAVKVPLPSAILYAKEMEKEKMIKSSIISGANLYSADRSSIKFLYEKRLFNIGSLYKSGLVEFLITEYSNPTIAVFGSYSKGEDIEKSDIDLYVETTKKIAGLERFEKVLQRPIQIFSYRNFQKIENKNLANSILNGVVLNGFLEAFISG